MFFRNPRVRCVAHAGLCLGMMLCARAWAQPAFNKEKIKAMESAIQSAITAEKLPGAVIWFERNGQTYRKPLGNRALVPTVEIMTEDTIFDAASLTKVVATTPAILLLVERGLIRLDDRVSKYIPGFAQAGKDEITIRQLLTHSSGLRPGIPSAGDWTGTEKAIELSVQSKMQSAPGKVLRYSDINFILLGEIVRIASGSRLDEFTSKELFTPMQMIDTGFLPDPAKLSRIAPTTVDASGRAWRGVVHDPTARKMGGVAGHAGLFLTAADLARFARMMIGGGEIDGVRILKPETVKLMTSVQTPPEITSRRGLGWDIDSGHSGPRGRHFPLGSYGHTGWTGTSLWLDPFSKSFIMLLSNRNHPDEGGTVLSLRADLATLAAEAIADFNFTYVPGALAPMPEPKPVEKRAPDKHQFVLNGIDVLVRENFARLKGLRVGLVTNHTGQDRQRNPTIDLLRAAPGVKLISLFSPEHGIRGTQDEKIGDSKDEKTGLPIHSLYGDSRKPQAVHLEGLDALVFDIQDIGCRFYTYASTMGLALEAAAESKKKFIVLDRINPINGITIDGPVLTEETTFVGFHPLPLRHGMTMGELARMFNDEKNLGADLEVVALENWNRGMFMDQTGQPWTHPSPNMRSLTQAILYPGVGLLEDALSVGRGTDAPFELVGAPYVDDVKLARTLNSVGLPGVSFMPVRFTPTASTHAGKECRGVRILLTDRQQCRVVDLGMLLVKTLAMQHPGEFKTRKIAHLLLHAGTLEGLQAGRKLDDIRALWQPDLKEFEKRRAKFLLY